MNRPKFDFGNVQNEEALIGSALLQPDILDRLGDFADDCFADRDLGAVWKLLKDLRDNGTPFDIPILDSEIRKHGIGIDRARMAKLFTSAGTAAHAVYHRDNVQDSHRRRLLAELATSLSEQAIDPTRPTDAILGDLEARSDAIRGQQSSGAVTIAAGIDNLLAEIDQQAGQRRRAESGLLTLDSTLGGMMPGEMIVLAARPGNGKTSLAIEIGFHNAEKGRAVLFVSLEMRTAELVARILVDKADVHSADIRGGDLSAIQRHRILEARKRLADVPFSIVDPAAATLRDIRQQARAQQVSTGLDLLIVDYLSLVQANDRRQQRWEAVSEISRGIKRLAKELQVPILVLQQLNREADQQEPRLSHLRESGSIEQDADAVLFLHRNDRQENATGGRDEIEFKLIVGKNRHGMTGEFRLLFDGNRTLFRDPAAGQGWQP